MRPWEVCVNVRLPNDHTIELQLWGYPFWLILANPAETGLRRRLLLPCARVAAGGCRKPGIGREPRKMMPAHCCQVKNIFREIGAR